MIVWVLFVWVGHLPVTDAYATKAECQERAAIYKKAVCISVQVPK